MTWEKRNLDLGPVIIGISAELIVIAFGVLFPISRTSAIRSFVAIGLLNVGGLGGAMTGPFIGRSWRSNALHGLVTGIIGGTVFAILLFGTVTNRLPITRYTDPPVHR